MANTFEKIGQLNNANLGSFGEFLYKKFAISLGLKIEIRRILEHDFIVTDPKNNKIVKVDVKTTRLDKSYYSGKRISPDIAYDLISIHNGIAKIFPDSGSPLGPVYIFTPNEIDNSFVEWNEYKSSKKLTSEDDLSENKVNRIKIATKIKNLIKQCGDFKCRVIFRGSVSRTRWKGAPDNLPGNENVIKKYDFTIFVQMVTVGAIEEIAKLYIFNHKRIEQFKMLKPDARQAKKGITKVIDIKAFESDFPAFSLTSIESLSANLNNNLLAE